MIESTHNSQFTIHNQIAYLGIPGSYSHTAATKYFGADKRYRASKTVSDVFEQVSSVPLKARPLKVDYGVVPLENSLHGNVVESFDLLGEHNLSIIGEVYLRIHHCLVGAYNDVPIRQVKRCYSHWQAISQCEPFFKKHPWIEPVFVGDTATAAKEVSQRKREDEVAIAGREAAKRYTLEILATDIEKHKENYTRFGVIGKTLNTEGAKVTLSFSVKHVPGSLVHALTPFAKNGINLMQIESRPLRNMPWEYNFFVDLEVGSTEENWQKTLKELHDATTAVKILGSYKKGAIYET